MQFKLLSQNRVQTQPTYIHTLDNKSFIVSYTDKTFEAYTEAKRYSLKQNFPSALCGYNISEDMCLLGLENGNGLLVRIRNDQADFNLQEWREKQYNLAFSVAIIFIGIIHKIMRQNKLIYTLLCMKMEHYLYSNSLMMFNLLKLQNQNTIQILDRLILIKKLQLLLQLILFQLSMLIQQLTIHTGNQIQLKNYYYFHYKFRQLSASQLKLFGQTINQYNDYWKQQCYTIYRFFNTQKQLIILQIFCKSMAPSIKCFITKIQYILSLKRDIFIHQFIKTIHLKLKKQLISIIQNHFN